MINLRYSKLPLAGKILLPILSVFLGMWTVGTVAVGYFETSKQSNDLERETRNAAVQIAKEIDAAQELLSFKAKSITDIAPLSEAVAAQDEQALLKILLPLRSDLKLDLVKIFDREGIVLSDLRSTVLGSAQLQDSEVMEFARQELLVNSLVVTADGAMPLLIKTLSVTSRQGDVGSIMVGYALTPKVLSMILGPRRQQILILQDSEVIAATLPIQTPVNWSPQSSPSQLVQIDGAAYLGQSIELPQIIDDRFQAVVLTPLAAFRASQRQLWLLVGSVGLVGGLMVSAISLWITRLITHRITKLTEATQKLASGDLAVHIPADGSDEVARLAMSFNYMTEQLKHRDRKIKAQLEESAQLVKELQQMPERVHMEKMAGLGQMVAGVAHEINNPVSFIYGNLFPAKEYFQDLLTLVHLYQQYSPNPPHEVREAENRIDLDFVTKDLSNLLESIQSGAERIRQIVVSLRNFSRRDEAVMKAVNIHDGLDSTLTILGHRLKAQSRRPAIEVIKDYGVLPPVYCFAGEINQVFMNILSNAIDALEESMVKPDAQASKHEVNLYPQIRLHTEVNDPNWITIGIANNGSEISEAARSKLFDPFFTTKEVGKGTGLGLSISYQIIVEKHRGKIWCNSRSNQGSEFIIQIPVGIRPAPPETNLLVAETATET